MIERTAPIQETASLNGRDWYFTPGAPQTSIEKFVIRNIVEQTGWYFRLPVTIVTYVYFFFVKWRLG